MYESIHRQYSVCSYNLETEIKYMAIDCLELHEFCNPYNLEII